MKITLSVIKADVGGCVAHSNSHPDVLKEDDDNLSHVQKSGLLIDRHLIRHGDDFELIMTHQEGMNMARFLGLIVGHFRLSPSLTRSQKLAFLPNFWPVDTKRGG